MKSFDEIIARAKENPTRNLAIAGKPDHELQAALEQADELGIAAHKIFDQAADAVAAVRAGEADILMKGSVDTKSFMQAILDRDNGLRTGKLISHIAVVEVNERLFIITDGGICLQPTLEQKADIIRNAVPVAQSLGMVPARVAVLAAVEKINPDMPETVDAEALSSMDIPGCVIQGPLAVDNAVSAEAARLKGVTGPVAGNADVLLVPSVLVGNIFAKGIMYFADSRFGGVVAGTARPVCFLSRADTAQTKLNTIALGSVMIFEHD